MGLMKNMETIIKEHTGCNDFAANLTANQLLNMFELLGLELKMENTNEKK